MRNVLSALVVFFSGCGSSSGGSYLHRECCGIRPIIGDGLRSSKGLRVIAGGRGTCPSSAEEGRLSFLVTVTIVNIANTELLVEPDQMDVFDSQGNRVRRAYPDRPFRCRGPLFSPQMNLGVNEECTIDAVFAGAADPSRLKEMRVELRGIRRQGNALPITIIFEEEECIQMKRARPANGGERVLYETGEHS
jgi:hypothetical protein